MRLARQVPHWIFLLVGASILAQNAVAQITTIFISSPIGGARGSSVEFSCSAFSNISMMFLHPRDLQIISNNVTFEDGRLTSIIPNATHKVYTLENLMDSDRGRVLQCSLSEVRSRPVPLQVFYPPTISDFNGTVVTVVAGRSVTIDVTIDANPPSTNTIEPSSTLNVPPSITTSGSSLLITDQISRLHFGTYLFVATNAYGSDRAWFVMDIMFPPDFTATISDSFNCEQFPNASWQCVARFGQEGVLYCDYQSNPGGTLNITTDVANSSDVSIVNSTIAIESAASENAGTYTCTATNTIEGQERVTTREIRFFVGDLPLPVENNTATVNPNGSVTLRWTHNASRNGIPVSSFSVSVGIIDSSSPPSINRTVTNTEGSSFELRLSADVLEPRSNYRVTIVVNNLLGSSDGRDITFLTTDIDMPTSSTQSNTDATTSGNPATTLPSFISILLLLTCVLTLL